MPLNRSPTLELPSNTLLCDWTTLSKLLRRCGGCLFFDHFYTVGPTAPMCRIAHPRCSTHSQSSHGQRHGCRLPDVRGEDAILQTLGYAPVMHRGEIFCELSRDCAQQIIGSRGRAACKSSTNGIRSKRGGSVLLPYGSIRWCPTGTPRTFRPCFDGGHERSLLHTTTSGSSSVLSSKHRRPTVFSLEHSTTSSAHQVDSDACLFSTRAPTTRFCHPPSAHDVDVVKKGE